MVGLLGRKLVVATSLVRRDRSELVRRASALVRRSTLETRIADDLRARAQRLALRRSDAATATAYVGLSRTLGRLHREEEAIAALRRAVELEPACFELHDELSTALYMSGDFDASVEAYAAGVRVQDELAARTGLTELGIRFLSGDWVSLIGSIALLDIHVKMTILGVQPAGRRAIVPRKGIGNRVYLDLWREHFAGVVTDPDARALLSPLLPRLRDHASVLRLLDGQLVSLHAGATEVERRWRAAGRGPLLSLPEEDVERGRTCLADMGVPEDAWFVGLHVREHPGHPRDVHDADIISYRDAIAAIVERGGWVVRMGDPQMTPFPRMEQVVDYALGPYKSEWMDVYLWADCRFFVGTTSGPIGVPPTFGRPCVQTNWSPFAFRHWYPDDLVIAKLYRSLADGRLARFQEALASPVAYTPSSRRLRALGFELVPNTPSELRAAVVEMLERLDGRVPEAGCDQELQRRFDALTLMSGEPLFGASKPVTAWLEAHEDLL